MQQNVKIITEESELQTLYKQLLQLKAVGIKVHASHADPYRSKIRLIQISTKEKAYFIDFYYSPYLISLIEKFFFEHEFIQKGRDRKKGRSSPLRKALAIN